MSLDIFFIDEDTVKAKTGISNAINGTQLRPAIKVTQDIFLQPALGSNLYNRLQSGRQSNNLTSDERNLLDNYIIDCLAFGVVSTLSHQLSYQFFAKGVQQKTADNSYTPSKNEIDAVETRWHDYAEFYKDRLIKFLEANCNLYPTYRSSVAAADTIYPSKDAYECPIYLGTRKKRTYGSSEGSGVSISGNLKTATYKATGGETSFILNELSTAAIYIAYRAGLKKELIETTTTSTEELQRVGKTITLPTGDIAAPNEVFSFLYI